MRRPTFFAPVLGKLSCLLAAIGLTTALMWLDGPVVFADVTAHVHMSTSPGGDEVTTVQSGTANVYVVLSYEDAAQTELRVRIFAGMGIVLFEHSDIYNGSGQRDLEITGQDILAGYVSAAQEQSLDLEDAVSLAQQSSSASAKRVRTDPAVAAAQTLDRILTTIKRYPLSPTTVDDLNESQELVAEVETQALRIKNGEVPDDQLDTALAELEGLVIDMTSALDFALEGIDTNTERPWLDGTYTTTLHENGLYKDGFDWEVSPEGVPGTRVPSPTAPTGQTNTPTPTETPKPTPTPTERPVTSTALPTSTPTVRATSTLQPARVQATTTPPPSQGTVQTAPIPLPPTATSTMGGPAPTAEIESPVQVPPTTIPLIAESQTSYPAPPVFEDAGTAPTSAVQAMSQNETPPQAEATGRAQGLRAAEVTGETPLAPQEARELPVVRIVAIVSALMLGVVALWLRARI